MSTEFDQEPHPRERDVFIGALALEDRVERAGYVDRQCAADNALRVRIEALLSEADQVSDFLTTPAVARDAAPGFGLEPDSSGNSASRLGAIVGDRIGRYRLREILGEGGCGVVFRAEQEEPVRRVVALKVIKPGMDSARVIARFEAERQALAMMDHPGIARVLDAGTTAEGRPYFVMELVQGPRITEYCERQGCSTEDRVRLAIEVCHAVQHAHQKGIIHRDLKPSNILVVRTDGRAQPKVIDFGIAKATEPRLTAQTLETERLAFVGTPAYMSPEQADLGGLDVDTRSDIHALGVLLYELLTGTTPFDSSRLMRSSLDECRRILREEDPLPPSARVTAATRVNTANHATAIPSSASIAAQALRRDLDWIVMKCLEKDRTRRYDSASALAADLQRYLDSEPVLARPHSGFYRLGKALRRHKVVVLATGAVLAAVIGGAAFSLAQSVRARAAEEEAVLLLRRAELEKTRARHEEQAARLSEYVADINLAQQALAAGHFAKARQLVEKHRSPRGTVDLRGFEWRHLWSQCRGDEHVRLPSEEASILSVAPSPDGRWIAVGTRDRVSIRDAATGAVLASLEGGAYSLAAAPDSAWLVAANGPEVHVWRARDWTLLTSLPGAASPVAVSPDGRWVATDGHWAVTLWRASDWTPALELRGAAAPFAFDPKSQRIAADSREGISLWRLSDGLMERAFADSAGLFTRGGPWFRVDRALTFSRDGQHLLAARNPPSERGVFVMSVWDVASGKEVRVLPADPERVEHTGVIAAVALSPDGMTLATGGMDHSLRLWDWMTGRRIATRQGHLAEVWTLAFSPDGRSIVSGAKDGGLNVWPAETAAAAVRDPLSETAGWPLGFSEDSTRLAIRRNSSTVEWVEVATGRVIDTLTFGMSPPAFGYHPLAADSALQRWAYLDSGSVVVRDHPSGSSIRSAAGPHPVDDLVMSPNGRVVLSRSQRGSWHWWEPDSRLPLDVKVSAERLVFSADSSTLAAFDGPRSVQIWDVVGRSPGRGWPLPEDVSPAGVLAPDGSLLAIATSAGAPDNLIQLWDTRSGRLLGECSGHKQGILSLAFSPDGRTLASSSSDSTVRLWNVASRQELLSLDRLADGVSSLLFSHDGSWLLGVNWGMGRTPRTTGPPGRETRLRIIARAPPMAEILGHPDLAEPSR